MMFTVKAWVSWPVRCQLFLVRHSRRALGLDKIDGGSACRQMPPSPTDRQARPHPMTGADTEDLGASTVVYGGRGFLFAGWAASQRALRQWLSVGNVGGGRC